MSRKKALFLGGKSGIVVAPFNSHETDYDDFQVRYLFGNPNKHHKDDWRWIRILAYQSEEQN